MFQSFVHIPNVSDSTAHSSSEIFTNSTQNYHSSTSHIFTTVSSNSFYNSSCARIPYAETFSCHSVDENFSAGCTVQCYVSNNTVFIGFESRTSIRMNHQFTTRKSFSEIIVSVAFQFHRNSFVAERPETLSGSSFEIKSQSIFWHSFRFINFG